MPTFLDLGDGVRVDVDAQLLELDRVDCEESLYEFLRRAWMHMDPAEWVDGWPIEAIAEHLQAVIDGEIKRLVVNIPPRMGKSSLTAVALPAWTWAQPRRSPTSGPGAQFLYASYKDSLSLRDSVKCRRLIKSAWYQARWGNRFSLTDDQDTKHRFGTDKGGERLITSIGAGVTGEGGNVVVIDDPNAANEALSEAKITEVVDWWDQTMSTRLNDRRTGAFVVIQQRLAENDLTGHILESNVGDWTHLCLPNRYEPDRSFITTIGWEDPRTEPGELLWPARLDEEGTVELEKTFGPWGAAGQLQQRPEPKGGGVIKRDWWLAWERRACGKCNLPKFATACERCPSPREEFPLFDYILASLDTAYTEKTENDFSALTIWGVFTLDYVAQEKRIIGPDGRPMPQDRGFAERAPNVMLMSAWQERLPLHELVEKVAKTCKTMKVDKLLIEAKAAGHSVAQEMRRLYGGEDFTVQLYDPRSMDKLARLYSVQHLFAEGMIYAPDRAWADTVITQVGTFPHGKHDDLVDTVSQALRHLRDMGLLTRSAERLAQIDDAKQFRPHPAPLYPG